MTPKQAKRMQKFFKAAGRLIDMMEHDDVRPFINTWNGHPNIRYSLAEFVDWHADKVRQALAEAEGSR